MINWTLRLKNKTTLSSIAGVVVGASYQVLGILGIVPAISENAVIQIIGLGLSGLVMLGVVVDPTTKGVSDSQRALLRNVPGGTYDEPEVVEDDGNEEIVVDDTHEGSDEDAVVRED